MKVEGLSELEFDSSGIKILIRRKTDKSHFAVKREPLSEKEDEFCNTESIKSPLSGTFYAASKHGMPPFVNDGDTVEEGTTLCIIEAMKVMNEIKADVKYKILKILAVNGKSVSAGEVLFLVKTL
ncbi:MAG: biotin/lipoyl-containing protein [Elusimicrobiota bacterium]